jgi:hypothetical protein
MKKTGLLICVGLLLAGCASTNGQLTSLVPVCDALVGPIHYSSTTNKNGRFAGANLVPDLKTRNRVGINLKCPGY